MQPPRLLAIAPDGWWLDPQFPLQLERLAQRWRDRSGAVYLRAHHRPLAWWQAQLARLPRGLPRGVSLPPDLEGPPPPALDFLHVPTGLPLPVDRSLPLSRPWHPLHEPAPPEDAAWLLVSPVLPTPSKPGAPTLGWDGLRAAIHRSPRPILALGGVGPGDLDAALACGAQGLACLRAAWQDLVDAPQMNGDGADR
jgi:hypothetical protein